MNTLKKFKTPIIFIIVAVAGFVVYANFFASSSADQGTSGLVQSSATANSSAAGDAFVSQLLTLQNITFHTEVLQDPAFKSLNDFSKPLVLQPVGRTNPFAPVNGVNSPPPEVATSSAKTTAKAS